MKLVFRNLIIISTCVIISGCAKSLIPIPGGVMPERNTNYVPKSDYGVYPRDYQLILKKYLKGKLYSSSDAKVEFVNKPSMSSIDHLGSIYTGYRICLSINEKNKKGLYTGYKTHLFIINQNKVNLHLFDSGLLKIPFELCVDINETKSIYLDDIPDQKEEITIDEMDKIDIKSRDDLESTDSKNENKPISNTYILCKFDAKDRTFVFNQSLNIFTESIGIKEIPFEKIKFSNTHIYGYYKKEELLINRVSGKATSSNGDNKPIIGECEILQKKKF